MPIFLFFVISSIGLFLTMKSNVKPRSNKLALVLINIICFTYVFIDYQENKLSFSRVSSEEEMRMIWYNYHKTDFSTDPQIVRSLTSNIDKPNQVISDDEYIYSISDKQIFVTSIKDLKVVKEIKYKDTKPLYLYVTDKQLIIIGENNNSTYGYILDKKNFNELKQFSIEATYVTSQLIDSNLYLITSKVINKDFTETRPSYIENETVKYLPYNDIYYIKDTYPNNLINIMKIDVNAQENIKMISYLGLGQVIYISENNIYAAEEKHDPNNGNSNKSLIIKINHDLKIVGLQEIDGYILGKSSLNEYNGNLRVVTTTHDNKGDNSHLYILNKNMKISSELKSFSKGNEVQAALFVKDKAYIETFNINDPFYVFDLSNDKKPRIISETKLESYHTNFIPFDEHKIIAWGIVLDEKKETIGIKMTLIDVTNPKEVRILSEEKFLYEEYNSVYTDLLYDCKPLLIDKEKRIIGFPIIYWPNKSVTPAKYKQEYVVYKINDKLSKLGLVSHNDDIMKGIINNNSLYTVSSKMIKESNLNNLKQIKEVYLK